MIFKGVGEYECEKCKSIEYDDYGIVRNYIEEHRGATTAEVSFATGISQREINSMLKEERFAVAANSRTFLRCEGCGEPIRSGRYCPTCQRLAAAAEAKRKHDTQVEQKKKLVSGTANEVNKSEDGAKRFKRTIEL